MKRLLLSIAVSLTFAGCTNPCLKLAERICDCEPTNAARDTCTNDAQNANATADLTSGDEDRCDALLDSCPVDNRQNCGVLETPEGREACGLARQP